jgi:hypothetical protein
LADEGGAHGSNFWFEDVVDAFLRACAEGRDWREAVAEIEAEADDSKSRRVLTQQGLKAKGISYSRQHLNKKVRDGDFPPPFQVPSTPRPKKSKQAEASLPV